jgi:hypothetical protein
MVGSRLYLERSYVLQCVLKKFGHPFRPSSSIIDIAYIGICENGQVLPRSRHRIGNAKQQLLHHIETSTPENDDHQDKLLLPFVGCPEQYVRWFGMSSPPLHRQDFPAYPLVSATSNPL